MNLKLVTNILLLSLLLGATGCAGFNKKVKNLVSGEEDKKIGDSQKPATRFSEQEQVRAGASRKYQRMTKEKFEESAEVQSNAGSLWVMEGQGPYLFAANTTRLMGDILNVKIEGAPKQQLQTKVRVISKLLERFEKPELRGPAGQDAAQPAAQAATPTPGAKGANGQQPPGNQQNQNNQQGQQQAGAEEAKPEVKFDVSVVPTRIVETLRDGSYRVKGFHPFMIGKREYKVIVTGIVRAEDFNDDGTPAPKLLDGQFDVVSSKKGMTL